MAAKFTAEFNGTSGFTGKFAEQDKELYMVKDEAETLQNTARGLLQEYKPATTDARWAQNMDRLQTDMHRHAGQLEKMYKKKKNEVANGVSKMESIGQGISDALGDTSEIVHEMYSNADKQVSKARNNIRKAAKTNSKWWDEQEDAEAQTGKILRDQAAATEMNMKALGKKTGNDVQAVRGYIAKMVSMLRSVEMGRKMTILKALPVKLLGERLRARKALKKTLAKIADKATTHWTKLGRVLSDYNKDVSDSASEWGQRLNSVETRDTKLLGRMDLAVQGTALKASSLASSARENLNKVEQAFQEDLAAYKTAMQAVEDSADTTTGRLHTDLLQEDYGAKSLASTERYKSMRELLEETGKEKFKGLSAMSDQERSVQVDYNQLNQDVLRVQGLRTSLAERSNSELGRWNQKYAVFGAEIKGLREKVVESTADLRHWRENVTESLDQGKVALIQRTGEMGVALDAKLEELSPFESALKAKGREEATEVSNRMHEMLQRAKGDFATKMEDLTKTEEMVHELTKQYSGDVINATSFARQLALRGTSLQNSKLTKLVVMVGANASKVDSAIVAGRDKIRRNVTRLQTTAEEAVTRSALGFEEKAQALTKRLREKLQKAAREIITTGAEQLAGAKQRGAKMEREAMDLRSDLAKVNKSAYAVASDTSERQLHVHQLIAYEANQPFSRATVGVRSDAAFDAALATIRDDSRSKVDALVEGVGQQLAASTGAVRDEQAKQASAVAHAVGEQTTKLVDDGLGRFARLRAEVAARERDVVAFTAQAQGKSANATAWFKKIAAAAKSSDAVAKNLEMAREKSSLKQQAMIDAKFRKLQKVVAEDVHNLGKQEQAMITALTERAKEQAQNLVHNSDLKGKALAERLSKIDTWLASQVQHIGAMAEETDGKLGEISKATRDFDEETVERLMSLQDMLEGDPATKKVATDAAAATQSGLGLEKVLEEGEHSAVALRAELADGQLRTEKEHRKEADFTKKKTDSDYALLIDAISDAEVGMNEAISAAKAQVEGSADGLPVAEKQMKRSVQFFELGRQQLAQRLQDLPTERAEKLKEVDSSLLAAREPFQDIGERIVDGLLLWDHVANGFFTKAGQDEEDWGKKFRELMQTGSLSLLADIAGVDSKLQGAKTEQDKRFADMNMWIDSNGVWQTDVQNALRTLKEQMGMEISSAEKVSKNFGVNLVAGAQKGFTTEQKRVDGAMGGMLDSVNSAIGESAIGLTPGAVAALTGGGADAAADSTAATLDPLVEGQSQSQQNIAEFETMVGRLTDKFGMAENVGETLLAQERAGVEHERSQALNALTGLQSGQSLLQSGAAPSLLESVARTLGAHGRLKARHQDLASRIAQLRAQPGLATAED